MIARVVVLGHEALNVRLWFTGQVIVIQQDLIFHGTTPALNPALGLWMVGLASGVGLFERRGLILCFNVSHIIIFRRGLQFQSLIFAFQVYRLQFRQFFFHLA